MEDYPEKGCPKHPNELWEWDGYCWICVSCILNRRDRSKAAEVEFAEPWGDTRDEVPYADGLERAANGEQP